METSHQCFLLLLPECVHVQRVCAGVCVCVYKCVAMVAPLSPPSSAIRESEPPPGCPSRLDRSFLKDTLPVNFTSSFS